jgi:predicted Zn-dependent protease with MMP-like domain
LLDRYLQGVELTRAFSRLKLKRPQTVKMYREVLDELYAEVEAGFTTKAKL